MIYKNSIFNHRRFAFYLLTFFTLLFLSPAVAEAATLTWDGGGADNNWSTAANWSPDAVPTSADVVVFNSTSTKAATIDQTFTVSSLQIQSNYGGTITQANGANLTINNGFTQAGGTFQGSDGTFNFSGTSSISGGTFQGGTGKVTQTQYFFFTMSGGIFSAAGNAEFFYINQTGGTFNAPAGTLTMKAVFNIGAAFNNSGGTIALNATSVSAPNAVFNNLTVNSGTSTIEINAPTVSGTLSLVDGILVNNSLKVNGSVSYASTFDGGSTRLWFNDSATRTVNLPAGNFLLPMILDNPNITVTTSGAGASTIQGTNEIKRGTFTQGNAALTFNGGGNGFIQSGGIFQGSAATLDLGGFPIISGGAFQGGSGAITAFRLYNTGGTFSTAGDVQLSFFDLTGGTFNAPAGTFTVVRDFVQTAGGAFNPNGGTVRFTGFSNCNFPGTATGGIDVATSLNFYNLQFDFAGCFTRSIANGDTLIVSNNLLLTSGSIGGGGRIRLNGTAVNIAAAFTGGGTVVELVQPNQNFVINNPASTVAMLAVEMNAANSTLTSSGSGRINFNSMNLLNGTVNQGAGIWDLSLFPGYSQSGGTFNGSAAALFIGNGLGNPTLTGGVFSGGTGKITSSFRMTGGTFSTQGDLDTSIFGLEGGIFNAPLGTMLFTGGNGNCFFTHTAGGTFNAGTGTVEIQQGICGINVNITETFNNLRFNGNVNEISAGDTLVVNGLLTFNGGGGSNGGSILANGNVIYSNSGGRGNTLVKFQDTATRTINLNGSGASYSALNTLVNNPNITINAGASASAQVSFSALTLQQGTFNQGDGNASVSVYNQSGGIYNSGTVSNNFNNFTLSGGDFNAAPTMTLTGNFTHTAAGGNFNEGTGTIFFNSTFNGANGIVDVNGSETFFNVRFQSGNGTNIAAGDTLIVSGTTILQGGTLNGGTLDVKGDVTTFSVNNGGNFQGGNASVIFSGAANQTFSNPNFSPTFGGTWTINKPNSAPLFENGYVPAAPTTLFLSGNVGSTTANSYPPFSVASGNVVQTGNFSHALGSLSLAPGTNFVNEFGGSLTLAGNLANDGSINLDGGGSGCPQADAIAIRSSVAGTQRQWSGAGTYRLVDIDLKDQNSTNPRSVYSGTDSGNNTNFAFNGGCLAPTAATVSIGGRVLKANGRGVLGAQIVIIDTDGQSRYATTNSFGFYRFDDVAVGQTVIVTVRHKTERFAIPTIILNVTDELTNVDFTAIGR